MNRGKEKLKGLIVAVVSRERNIPLSEAEQQFNNSALAEMLETDPSFVGHYPPEYWIENDFV